MLSCFWQLLAVFRGRSLSSPYSLHFLGPITLILFGPGMAAKKTAVSACGAELHAHLGDQIKLVEKMDSSKHRAFAVALLLDKGDQKVMKRGGFGFGLLLEK